MVATQPAAHNHRDRGSVRHRALRPSAPRSSNSVSAVQQRSQAFLTWMPPAQQLAVDRRDPPMLLSLLLSATAK
jgi:hypothetical protein